VVLNVLRKNQANIRSYLESFNHDPLVEDSKNLKIEIKEALKIVEKKLQGHMFGTGTEKHLTIDEQVAGVILNAINEESLAAMYIGWMPWL
jgi:phosphatidylinositol kinase/protein kinase (PI-3  family)